MPTMLDALKQHWPEYLMEAAAIGLFMLAACVFGVLLEHPDGTTLTVTETPARHPSAGGRGPALALALR